MYPAKRKLKIENWRLKIENWVEPARATFMEWAPRDSTNLQFAIFNGQFSISLYAAKRLAGVAFGDGGDLCGRSHRHDSASRGASFGTQVDHPVGAGDHVEQIGRA